MNASDVRWRQRFASYKKALAQLKDAKDYFPLFEVLQTEMDKYMS